MPVSDVKIIDGGAPDHLPARDRVQELFDMIREKAYRLFETRGVDSGYDLDDWLTVEREVLFSPACELRETASRFHLRVIAPSFRAEDFEVRVGKDRVAVHASSQRAEDGEAGELRYSDWSGRELFREVVFPAEIDPAQVHATLDHGMLRIEARKASVPAIAAAA